MSSVNKQRAVLADVSTLNLVFHFETSQTNSDHQSDWDHSQVVIFNCPLRFSLKHLNPVNLRVLNFLLSFSSRLLKGKRARWCMCRVWHWQPCKSHVAVTALVLLIAKVNCVFSSVQWQSWRTRWRPAAAPWTARILTPPSKTCPACPSAPQRAATWRWSPPCPESERTPRSARRRSTRPPYAEVSDTLDLLQQRTEHDIPLIIVPFIFQYNKTRIRVLSHVEFSREPITEIPQS